MRSEIGSTKTHEELDRWMQKNVHAWYNNAELKRLLYEQRYKIISYEQSKSKSDGARSENWPLREA
jgi:hypothetical protein